MAIGLGRRGVRRGHSSSSVSSTAILTRRALKERKRNAYIYIYIYNIYIINILEGVLEDSRITKIKESRGNTAMGEGEAEGGVEDNSSRGKSLSRHQERFRHFRLRTS